MNNKPKIIAISSNGGHWTQMVRITKPLSSYYEIRYASTAKKSEFHVDLILEDFSGSSFRTILKFIKCLYLSIKYIYLHKPRAVVSTGALPGLAFCMAAKILGVKAIWVDSIANSGQLSQSGKIAKYVCNKTYTQWSHLSDNKTVFFNGRVL